MSKLPRLRTLRDAYSNQKHDAAVRRIAFELSLEEWLTIWKESGHLHERGKGGIKYCMARINDTGPYAKGNVEIVTNLKNNISHRYRRKD